jgi:hypothetical protein
MGRSGGKGSGNWQDIGALMENPNEGSTVYPDHPPTDLNVSGNVGERLSILR